MIAPLIYRLSIITNCSGQIGHIIWAPEPRPVNSLLPWLGTQKHGWEIHAHPWSTGSHGGLYIYISNIYNYIIYMYIIIIYIYVYIYNYIYIWLNRIAGTDDRTIAGFPAMWPDCQTVLVDFLIDQWSRMISQFVAPCPHAVSRLPSFQTTCWTIHHIQILAVQWGFQWRSSPVHWAVHTKTVHPR